MLTHSPTRRWPMIGLIPPLLSLSFVPTLLSAQEPPPAITPLGPPQARSGQGFTSIFDAVELADGRVLMTDNRERVIAIVDLEDGSVTPLGREGEGPEEYRSAFTILPQADGHFLIYDATLRRFLSVSPQGAVLGVEPLNPPPLQGFSAPRGPDADGYLYVSYRRIGPGGLLPEATLYGWNPSTEDLKEVASIANFAPGQQGSGFVPMPREDAWTFLPDGSVGLLVAEDYHLEWSGGAAGSSVGPALPHPRIKVGKDEREAWLDQFLAQPAGGTARLEGGGGGGSSRSRPPVDPGRFPEVVPPFEGGYVPAAPWGEMWVRLEVLSDSTRTVFDVLNRRGALVRRVSVEGDAHVVGFGSDAVFLARKDPFDLAWLERYGAGPSPSRLSPRP